MISPTLGDFINSQTVFLSCFPKETVTWTIKNMLLGLQLEEKESSFSQMWLSWFVDSATKAVSTGSTDHVGNVHLQGDAKAQKATSVQG